MLPTHLAVATIAVATTLAGAEGPVQQEVAWTNPGDGAWSSAASWGCPFQPKGCVPDNDATYSYAVLIDGAAVDLDWAPTIDRLRLTDGATVNGQPAQVLTIVADASGTGDVGTVHMRNATIVLDVNDLVASGPPGATLTIDGEGGGTAFLEMTNGTIRGGNGGEAVLFGGDTIVRGQGWIGLDNVGVVNKGMILADRPGDVLEIDPGPDNMVSDGGLLRAENGGTLRLHEGVFDIGDGEPLTALDASVVELDCATILGGVLETGGTGEIRVVDHFTYIVDATNLGRLVVMPDVQGLHLQGSLVNMDTLELRSPSGQLSRVLIDSPEVTLTGGGLLHMNGAGARINAPGGTGNTLTNVDNTIRGEGDLGATITRIVNHGSIVADGAAPLQVSTIAGADALVNTGTMRAESGARLTLLAGSSGAECLNTGGLIEARDGSVIELRNPAIIGGMIATEGTGEVQVNDNFTYATDVTNLGLLVVMPNVQGLHLRTSLVNADTLELRSPSGQLARVIVDSAEVTLTGGGIVHMTGAGATINASGGGNTLTNMDNTIRGQGSLGASLTRIVNHGTIVADGAGPLVVFPVGGASALVNTGTMRAEGGARLTLNAEVNGSEYFNDGGRIEAGDASEVELHGPTIVGGTLAAEGSGEMVASNGATLVDVTNTGRVVSPAGTPGLRLEGTIVNTGTIEIPATAQNALLLIDADTTLTGGGIVEMTGARSIITDHTLTNTLTNVDNTIRGAGDIGQNLLHVVNEAGGTILADRDVELRIHGADASGFDNRGTLVAGGTAGVSIPGAPFTTSGVVEVQTSSALTRTGGYPQTAGRTTVDGVLTINGGSLDLQGGRLDGSGTVNSSVENGTGRVAPGGSTGILTVSGGYTQTVDGLLEIEIAGLLPGDEHDRLAVGGNVSLGGELALSIVDPYLPQPGDEVTIVVSTGGEITGTFDVVDCTIGFDIVYEASSVRAVFGGDPCVSDADCSGSVDFGDLLRILGAWGPYDPCPPYRPEDIDEDCAVTFGDILGVLGQWGACP